MFRYYTLVLLTLLMVVPAGFAAVPGMKTLPGHVPSVVAHLSAKGILPATNRLSLAIGVPLRDKAGLDDYLHRLYDPQSPDYRRFLTPAQFTSQFGPAEQDYQAVIAFASRHHLSVTHTHGNRLLLDVSGSVADVQDAFNVSLKVYRHPTEDRDFYAPDTEPSVDASLPIADISGLNNYGRPHPQSLVMDTAAASAHAVPRSGSGSGGTYLGNDFRAAYLPGVTLTGTGQQVGLLEFDGYYASDIAAYETAAGLPSVPLQTVLLDGYHGGPTSAGNGEVSLDIEMAVAMAPGLSKIVVFEAGPSGLQNDVLNLMAASNQVSQLSSSWGWLGGPTATTDSIFMEMAAQGQSFFNAVGDTDAFTTGANSVNGVDNTTVANAPSSSPYITQVGGTTLSTTGPGGSWSAETVWNWNLHKGTYVGTSGGISSFYAIPTWQANVSMSANGGSTIYRNVPDVALTADNILVYYGNGTSGTFGGTSCAAPLWAGLTALINQQSLAASRPVVGFVNPAIYSLAAGTNYSVSFHDVTTGSNAWPSSPSSFFAVPGYDLCTGWGTPGGQGLINALAGPPDTLVISPATGFSAAGVVSGPFNVTTTSIQLSNSAAIPLPWSLLNLPAWLQASATSGTLMAGAATGLTVSLSGAASNLVAGAYSASLKFTNASTHVVQSVPFALQVVSSLVQNGGFETGDFTGWSFSGTTTITTQFRNILYDGVENSNSYPLVVHSGNYGAFLGDTQLATLSQTLPTTSGVNYLLSFWLDNPTSGTVQKFQVNWNGANIYAVTNPPVFAWTNLQFIVTAPAGTTTLQFGVENDPANFGLDDISVTRIPAVTFKTIAPVAGALNFTWATAAGLVYQVQYKTNLLQPAWLNLTKPMTATTNSITVSDTTTDPQRFYRLIVAP